MRFHNFFLLLRKKQVEKKFCQQTVFEIVEKVRCNIPDFDVEKTKFFFEIKTEKPLFVMEENEIDLGFAKNLFLANLIEPFHLVILKKNNQNFEWKNILNFATVLHKNKLTKKQKEILFCLNINFEKNTKRKFERKNQIEVCGGLPLIKKQFDFGVESENENVKIVQYYFNGNFYFFKNKSKNNKIIIKKIFYFNKFNYLILKNNIIYNLNNTEKWFVKCTEKCCVELARNKNRYLLVITVFAQNDFALYVGKEEKLNVFDVALEEKIGLCVKDKFQKTKLVSCDEKLNKIFNETLPKKIVKKQNMEIEINTPIMEEKLMNDIRKKFLKLEEKIVTFGEGKLYGNLKMLFCGKQKSISFIKSKEKKLVVDGIEYFNCNCVTKNVFCGHGTFGVFF